MRYRTCIFYVHIQCTAVQLHSMCIVCRNAKISNVLIRAMMSEADSFNFAALHSDNSFEVFVDQNLVNSGNLLEDMRSLSVLLACGLVLCDICCMIFDLIDFSKFVRK